MTETEAFERAVFENPDDVATWCAFADYLADRDDPRGEFMQIQLALEDKSRSKDDRDVLKSREAELLVAHEREWLGELAPHLLDYDDLRPRVEHWWARGFLTELRVEHLTLPLAQSVAAAPCVRFLRRLHIENVQPPPPVGDGPTLFSVRVPTPEGAGRHDAYFELLTAPWLKGLRELQVGEVADNGDDPATGDRVLAPGLEHLVARMPGVEELHLLCHGYDTAALFELPTLTNLQVLRVVGLGNPATGDSEPVPLGALARNPALTNLTHLLVHPNTSGPSYLPLAQVRALVDSPRLKSLTHLQLRLSNMGDDGAGAVVQSGILQRLGWLDLRNGIMTDDAARIFANCPDAKRLRRLDLSRNALTQVGVNLLTRAGVNVVARSVWSRRELEEHEARVRNQRGQYDPDDEGREGDME